jgi:hypothetical protein
VSSKEVQEKLITGGFVPNPMNGEATVKYIKGLTAEITKVLRKRSCCRRNRARYHGPAEKARKSRG